LPNGPQAAAAPPATPPLPVVPLPRPTPDVTPESTGFAAEVPLPVAPPIVEAKPPATASEPAVGPNWFNQLQALPKRPGNEQPKPAPATVPPVREPQAAQTEADPFDPAIFNRQGK
jgi:hypothetical protein